MPAAYRAFLLVDSYLYGFMMQEATWPNDEPETAQLGAFVNQSSPDADYPALAEAMAYILSANASGRALHDREFEHGLEMILDGLERVRGGISPAGPRLD